jgi:CheY-like chemotaxis protein
MTESPIAVKKTVLLVDDDNDFVAASKELFEQSGYTVLTAPDGNSGVSIAREFHPDLMILDVMMKSDTEGIELSRRIRMDGAFKNMPVILVTGMRKALELSEPLRPDDCWLPVAVVLEKPVDPAVLLEEVCKALASSPIRSA